MDSKDWVKLARHSDFFQLAASKGRLNYTLGVQKPKMETPG